MRSTVLALAATLAVSGTAQAVAAQSPPTAAPYSELRIRLSVARNVNHERLHDFWDAGTGAGAALTTPFYVGSVGVGATFIPFHTKDASRRDFRALMLGLDWGVEVPVGRWAHLRASARVGDFVMLVENPDVWLDSESELFVGGELSASVDLWRNLGLNAAGSYAHVYTRPSLGLAFLTLGLEYAARTPGWLRAILE